MIRGSAWALRAPMKRNTKVRKIARAHEGLLAAPRIRPAKDEAPRAENAARNQRIERLFLAGLSDQQIAQQVGMSGTGVYRVRHSKLLLPIRTAIGMMSPRIPIIR